MSLNPKASVFVPGKFSFTPAQTAQPAQPAQPTQPTQPVQPKATATPAQPKASTPQPKPEKPQPKENWEDEAEEEKEKKVPVKVPEPEKPKFNPVVNNVKIDLDDNTDYGDEDDEEEEKLEIVDDDREHVNLVFIGHVDAGKSTLSGNILFLTGMVDARTIEKYEKEAKLKNRATWFYAFIMDTNEEERAKGKTVEVGRAHFATEKKRYTILDAPGHKNYVPNMISGVAQADLGVLVISARKNEYEAGFEKGGQTTEHAILAKTLGIKKLIVAVNKMDETTVNWSEERFNHIKTDFGKFLRTIGYNPSKDVEWVPCSGLSGSNVSKPLLESECPWYKGKSLLETLDDCKPLERMESSPLRVPVLDKYKESGKVYILGKIEAGVLKTGETIRVLPNQTTLTVAQIQNDMGIITVAKPGENAKIVVRASSQVEEDSIFKGAIICHEKSLTPVTTEFVAQIQIIELLEHKSVFTPGYECVLHAHTAVEDVTVTLLLEQLDKKGQPMKKLPKFVPNQSLVIAHLTTTKPVCLEKYDDFSQLGRFTLRDEGKTIAFGKVLATNGPTRQKKKN